MLAKYPLGARLHVGLSLNHSRHQDSQAMEKPGWCTDRPHTLPRGPGPGARSPAVAVVLTQRSSSSDLGKSPNLFEPQCPYL